MGTKFAVCGWNAALVDGTYTERALMEIGRSFPFRVELSQAEARREIGAEQQAVDHFEECLPLLRQ